MNENGAGWDDDNRDAYSAVELAIGTAIKSVTSKICSADEAKCTQSEANTLAWLRYSKDASRSRGHTIWRHASSYWQKAEVWRPVWKYLVPALSWKSIKRLSCSNSYWYICCYSWPVLTDEQLRYLVLCNSVYS